MTVCSTCGEEIGDDGEFCPNCGEQAPKIEADNVQKGLVWKCKIPVITSSVVVKQLALALGGGFLVVFIVIALTSPRAIVDVTPILVTIYLLLLGMALLIAWLLQRGGADGTFAVTDEGVGYAAGDLLKTVNRVTLAGGAAGGSLSGIGGSIINISREMDSIQWDEVRSVSFQERERTIVIYRKVLIAPIMLACTPDNFSEVKDLIRFYAPPDTIKE